ncbi:hypothetical protein F2Q68_00040554 [Brassica cretica]|uniref:Uncharacterized protein n=1 Tax=Brassica cretica TaxID=69181 RepID=A0A8S9MKV3_BRACR|nr:hypothetical protein F2Q68_00040554 [Brassica cretica]
MKISPGAKANGWKAIARTRVLGFITDKNNSQALKFNSQTPVSGDLTAKKPNGKDVVSSTELIKRAGQTGVSPVVAVSGDPKSKKLNGKAVLSSAEPIKRAGQTGVYPVVAVSGDPKSKKLDGKAVVSSAEPIRRTGGSRANAVSGELIPKKSNRKAVVSSSDEVLFFKNVKFGPQEGEIRFRLIHFWEARNAHTKILIGLEMILIDGQVYTDIYDFVSVLLGRSNTNIHFFFPLSTGYFDPRVHPTDQD